MSEKQLKLEILLSAIDKATAPIKQLMASSNGLSKEVKSLRDKMRELDKTQSQMDSYRKVSSQLGVTNAALKTAQEKVKALAGQMNTASEPTKALSKAFDAAKKAAGELKTQATELSVKQQRMRETLHGAGVETKNLAQHQRTLRDQTKATSAALDAQTAKLKARNQVLAQKQAVKARYDSGMAQRDKLAGSGMAMSGAGAVAGAAVLAPAKAFAEAEDASTQLKVAMMGAGGVVAPEFEKVSAMAAKFGAELPGTTAQFTDMMRILVQKGMDAKTVIGGAGEATANLSILTKTGFSETADAISVLQDSMGVADKDMVAAADSMQRLYNVGMKVGDIREGFKAMGPALTYLKKGGLEAVQALSPLLAITDAAGMDAGSAGNAYNKIIRGSVDKKKVGKANAELEGTGIKLDFVDAQGNFAGVNNMVSQIMKIKNLSDQTRKTVVEKIFGSDKEVAETLDALMKAGVPGIEAMKKKLDAQASMQERIKAQLGTLKNLWDAAGGSFNALLVALGEAFAPQIKSLVQGIGDLSDKMTAWAKAHPMIAGGIMRIIAAVAIVLTLFGALTLALAGLMGPMLVVNAGFGMLGAGTGTLGARLLFLAASAFPALTTAALAFGAALMATPIGWIAAGIAAIAVAGLVLYRYWEPLGAFLSGVWDGFAAGMRTALPAMQPMIQAVSALAAGVANLIGPLSSTSQELGTAASMGAALGTAIAAMVDFALTPIKLLLASLSAVAAAAVALSNGDFSGASAAAKNAFTSTAAGQSALAQDDSDAARMAARAPLSTHAAGTEKMQAIKSNGAKNGGATSQNITINVTPTPGMNEQALGKVVKKEVQSALANQPANNRAALYDRD